MMKISVCVFYFCLFCIVGISRFGEAAADSVIAVINDEAITRAELDTYVNLLKVQMGEERWRQFEMSEEKALEALVEDRLILQEAKLNEKDLNMDKRMVNSRIEQIKKGYKTEQEFLDALMQQGLSVSGLNTHVKEQMLRDAFIDREIRSRIFIGPQEVTDYYNAHIEEFNLPEQAEIDSIAVDDILLAEDIHTKLELGLGFEALKERYSKKNVLAGMVSRGQLRGEIDDKVFSLAEGHYSSPIEVKGSGYYIFLILKKYPPGQKLELIDVQDKIRDVLFNQEFQKRLNILMHKLKSKSFIDIKDA